MAHRGGRKPTDKSIVRNEKSESVTKGFSLSKRDDAALIARLDEIIQNNFWGHISTAFRHILYEYFEMKGEQDVVPVEEVDNSQALADLIRTQQQILTLQQRILDALMSGKTTVLLPNEAEEEVEVEISAETIGFIGSRINKLTK